MKTTADQPGATIVFPKIAGDPMIDALSGRAVAAERRRIGTLPNRFKAAVPTGFRPQLVEEAVRDAWQALADAVRAVFVHPVHSLGSDTLGIWDRQVSGFWEIAWVMGPADRRDGEWLDWRKNWRSHRPPAEAGDHCTIMGDWQEISGWTRFGGTRPKQDAFWAALRDQRRVGDINVTEGERLSSLALIKRLFPLLRPDELPPQLWPTTEHWHSTGHIAAIPWLAEAADKERGACDAYAGFVRHKLGARWSQAEQSSPPIPRLNNVGDIAALDSNTLFFNDIRNERTVTVAPELRAELLEARESLAVALARQKVARDPGTYYALLRMDGDGVGKLLGEPGGEEVVGSALQRFVPQVIDTVAQSDGVLVYAGGDDVLALLPTDTAIPAAIVLEQAYHKSFAEWRDWPAPNKRPTISASLIFADHHEPLRAALHASHVLLEDAAKEGNGRSSLAVAVQKPSGSAISWVTAWRDGGGRGVPEALDALAARLKEARDISARLAYSLDRLLLGRLGERFDELELAPSDIAAILQDAIGRRRDAAGRPLAVDAPIVAALLFVAKPHRGPGTATAPPVPFSTDALRLAFFLAGRTEVGR